MSVCEHGIDTSAMQCHKCDPLGSLGVSQLNRMLEIKQDDWLDACKEIDRLTAENERLRGIIQEAMQKTTEYQVRDILDRSGEALKGGE